MSTRHIENSVKICGGERLQSQYYFQRVYDVFLSYTSGDKYILRLGFDFGKTQKESYFRITKSVLISLKLRR